MGDLDQQFRVLPFGLFQSFLLPGDERICLEPILVNFEKCQSVTILFIGHVKHRMHHYFNYSKTILNW